MTKSHKKGIINRVNWIHKNRDTVKEYQSQISKLQTDISKVTDETIEIMEALKKDMGNLSSMNIKMDDKYYTLIQNGCIVEIEPLCMHIESN